MFRGRGKAWMYDSNAIFAELFGMLLLASLSFAVLWLTRRRTPPSYLLLASSGREYPEPLHRHLFRRSHGH
jgi:hypothetical protein